MTAVIFSLLDFHWDELRHFLCESPDIEKAAYLFFGHAEAAEPRHSDPYRLLVSQSVAYIDPAAILSSSSTHVSWDTSDLLRKLKVADAEGLILGIAHSHGAGYCQFSETDNGNEAELIRTIQNRNGSQAKLASLLLTSDGNWRARLWKNPSTVEDAVELRIIGSRLVYNFTGPQTEVVPEFLSRQVVAFGAPFNRQLRRLRVTVVGCGGTGSAVATLLTRLGVGTITLIDNDTVELTNLNRLHGATIHDADAHRPKVDVLKEYLSEIGLGTVVQAHKGWVSSPECRDMLRHSHIVFGCTDDNAGRLLLNRLAYYYQIPVIDVGLAMQLSGSEKPVMQALDGRVTVLLPGYACLLCRGVINVRRASEESLKRSDPAEYERRRSEAYVLGEGDPNPAVVTFTTELACMAVNELIHRLQGFRGESGETVNRVRLFHRAVDLRPGCPPDPECRICGNPLNWCLGDVDPFLGIVT